MKQWRKDAAKFKAFMIEAGLHKPGARYGKAIRDRRKAMLTIKAMPSPLLTGLIRKHYPADPPALS